MYCVNELNNLINKSYPGLRISIMRRRGRFSEEENIEYYVLSRNSKALIGVAKIFHGRKPYYRKWIELFSLKNRIVIDSYNIIFPDSLLEDALFSCLSNILGPGEWIYVEYEYDYKTQALLERNTPPILTRLGYLLFRKGFTWFKDWYYPEGFMEGAPKLQGEKPLNEEVKRRHLQSICKTINEWSSRIDVLKSIDEDIISRVNELKNICLKELRR
jgi:hypothetical protein